MINIHSSSIISPNAKIGKNVTIGPFCIVHDGVEIADDVTIDSYCEIGIPTSLAKKPQLSIGKGSKIRSHSVLYIGSKIGEHFVSGHSVCIRENSLIGVHVQLGSRGDIQGDCNVGDYTKMHADVHIGKMSNIGSYVWLFPEVLLTNDATPPSEELQGVTIEDFAVLAAKVLVLPGVVIEKDSVVAAGSVVKNKVPAGKLYSGNPGQVLCDASILKCATNIKQKAYPWRYRFHRGYSEQDIQNWLEELNELENKKA
ncbi:acyltransferase [Vibrio splendidus]|uniref:acyltransferase n=1 Tax=Vibrio splendidus TaxID=29497 RepID=UPI003D129E6D